MAKEIINRKFQEIRPHLTLLWEVNCGKMNPLYTKVLTQRMGEKGDLKVGDWFVPLETIKFYI